MSAAAAQKKRKHNAASDRLAKKVKKERGPISSTNRPEQLLVELETAITEGTDVHENIVRLFSLIQNDQTSDGLQGKTLVLLCKTFTRLMASGSLSAATEKLSDASMLQRDYREYHDVLQGLLRQGSRAIQVVALQLSMRTLKAHGEYLRENSWSSALSQNLLVSIVEASNGTDLRQDFIKDYFTQFNDCAFYGLEFLSRFVGQPLPSPTLDNVIDILCSLTPASDASDEEDEFWITSISRKTKKGKPVVSITSIRRNASAAWLAVLSSPSLNAGHRKRLLQLVTPTILPWLNRPETLFDFLTSSFSQGGNLSLLSLSGIYHLITVKNLDYPSFYPKLYSLLTPSLMHSKHRSRFLRHLQIFLSSTHLPVALVASFLKRLSRLCLFAPPAAIVAIVPYIYNLLKSHPQTTFMVHRELPASIGTYSDPFDPEDPNPLTTDAVSSSLWELHTLASPTYTQNGTPGKDGGQSLGHYHPNVSSIAQIICLQFTKQHYNTDDFLDHSYVSMLEAELKRGEVKKEPVVEWKIPKRMLVRDLEDASEQEPAIDGSQSEQVDLVRRLWTFD